MKVKIRNKVYCVLWLIVHGFIPKQYFWSKKIKLKKTTHNIFSYEKFELCGKVYTGRKCGNESWDINEVWSFPEGLIIKLHNKSGIDV